MISGSTGWEKRAREAEAKLEQMNAPVTYRTVDGYGPLYAVHGTSSNSYANELEAKIRSLRSDLEHASRRVGRVGFETEAQRPTQGDLDTMRARMLWALSPQNYVWENEGQKTWTAVWYDHRSNRRREITTTHGPEYAIDAAISLDK